MKVCARDHGVQCFVLCTLCTQQMWSTLTAFLIFGSIMSSLEGVFACEHQREMNKNCQLPVHTRLKLNCWNKHLRSLCADLRFSPRVFPETWRRGLYLLSSFRYRTSMLTMFLTCKAFLNVRKVLLWDFREEYLSRICFLSLEASCMFYKHQRRPWRILCPRPVYM